MSLRVFRIDFDRPNATYMVGETVSGKITLDITKEKVIRGLFLTAKGEARVRWDESERSRDARGKRTTRNRTYRNSEEYFSIRYNILGVPRSDSRQKINVGCHEYPFTFQLPYNIPSSFEGRHSYIRYTVKAVLDRPWKFDHESKCAFTVICSLDLNNYRDRCLGIDDEFRRDFHSCCCFKNGFMNLRVTVPVCGYVPGQTIGVTLAYENLSNDVQMTKICTKLVRKLTLYASHPHTKKKTVTTEINSVKTAGPFPSCGDNALELRVPPIPPSYLEFCSIIDLEYQLVVFVHITGMRFRISKGYPIIIGTIPLYYQPEQSVSMPMPATMPSAPYSPPDDQAVTNRSSNTQHQPLGFVCPNQTGSSSVNWNIPPPSYEECMSRTDNIKDHDESNYVFGVNDSFAPRYPVFSYLAQSTHRK